MHFLASSAEAKEFRMEKERANNDLTAGDRARQDTSQ